MDSFEVLDLPFWDSFTVTAAIVGALVLGLALFFSIKFKSRFMITVSLITTLSVVALSYGVHSSRLDARLDEHRQQELQELGYRNVDVDSVNFVAEGPQGEYVRGFLKQVGGTYYVVEIQNGEEEDE